MKFIAFKSNRYVVILLMWLIAILISVVSFKFNWNQYPTLKEIFAGHIIYTFVSLPVAFGKIFKFSKLLQIVTALGFWPLVAFFHYRIIKSSSWRDYVFLSALIFSAAPNWLMSSMAIMGV